MPARGSEKLRDSTDMYLPFFTMIEFVVMVGWMKVRCDVRARAATKPCRWVACAPDVPLLTLRLASK